MEFRIDSVTTYVTEVVTFLREEELLDDAAGCFLVWRLGITKLTIDILAGFLGIVGGILLKGVVDDRVVDAVHIVSLNQDGLDVKFKDFVDMFLGELHIALNNHLGTLHRDYFAGILVNEVLGPRLHHTGGELFADDFLQTVASHFDFFSQSEDIKDVLVRLIADGAEQSGDGEFLLTVDIRVHDVVDIGRELHPRALERYDTC